MRKILGVALLVGCGGVRYTSSTTKGVGCNDFSEALCQRAVDCGYITSAPGCRTAVQDGCCGANKTCGDNIFNPTGAADCVNRISTERCDAIGTAAGPTLPAYCRQMF